MARISVKIDNLRKLGYTSFKDWLLDDNNIYTGRKGRLWITDPITKEREVFIYKSSIFANPFKVGKDGTTEECINLYKQHLYSNLELLEQLHVLKGKNLGCFCNNNSLCHNDILLELLQK